MKNQALYKTHCKTFKIAQKITGAGFVTQSPNHPFLGFRCFPQYRSEAGKELRKQVLNHIILVGRKNI
jgi:hypothetical protein